MLVAPAAAALSDAQKCESAVELAAAKYAQCRLKAESKFTKTADAGALASALSTCAGKLTTAYNNAFARWSASCPTVEPASGFDAYLAQCSTEVEAAAAGGSFPVCGDGALNTAGEQCDGADLGGESCSSLGFLGGALACTGGCAFDTSACASQAFPATGQTTCWNSAGTVIPCAGTGHDGDVQAGATLAYVDNGDGTVTDVNTGLMWEKLSDDGSIHDKDTTYVWNDTFAVKVAALNSGSFAGYSDWRVPNVKELQSIVNYENVVPAVSPAFNTACAPACTVLTCSCTVSSYYWSSSTYANFPTFAWAVSFFDGNVGAGVESNNFYVRAVRAGS